MIGVFKWGYGSNGKSLAFWGWVEESVGGWGQISKLVAKRTSAVCAVVDRGHLPVTGTNKLTATVIGADCEVQRFSTSTGRAAGLSIRDGKPGCCKVVGLMKSTGRAVRDGASGRTVAARTWGGASTIVTPEKAQ